MSGRHRHRSLEQIWRTAARSVARGSTLDVAVGYTSSVGIGRAQRTELTDGATRGGLHLFSQPPISFAAAFAEFTSKVNVATRRVCESHPSSKSKSLPSDDDVTQAVKGL
jgi:hypothetical protein